MVLVSWILSISELELGIGYTHLYYFSLASGKGDGWMDGWMGGRFCFCFLFF